MSAIWIFREPRSGSTWFSNYVVTTMNRTHCFIDRSSVGFAQYTDNLEFAIEPFLNTVYKYDPNNTVFTTHFFSALATMDRFDDPIVIRCARKNKTEQFMSHCLAQSTRYQFTNITTDEHQEKNKQLFDWITQNPMLIPKKDLVEYMRISARNDDLWNRHASKFRNFTVYYEDLCETGVDIPPLNLYNCKIEEGLTQKLPEYKSRVFLNYDMIQRWANDIK
jgi:hypothetical protein